MAEQTEHISKNSTIELSTFYVGDALCGIDILKIQEINKQIEVTNVPQAPDYVTGVMNLRGRIITIIDLGKKLGLSPTKLSKDNRNIIVDSKDEQIGLLVDKINDVLIADSSRIETAPANLGGVQGIYFSGVLKTDTSLIGMLNIEEVLKDQGKES